MVVRIKIAKDKAQLVQDLVNYKDTTGPFQTYADVLVFAATLGAKYKKRVPLDSISKEPAPINLEVFVTRGYDLVLKMLAVAETQDVKILSNDEPENEEQLVLIFEEYANGGLTKLQDDLRGSVDYSERILLLITQYRLKPEKPDEDFDLTRFL